MGPLSIPDKINIFNAVGAWVAAIGTISAVIVALILARRDSKIKLKILAGHRLIITAGSDSMPDYCQIKVVNVGFRKATITGVGWNIGIFGNGPFKRKKAIQLFDTVYSCPIPVTLADGDEASWMLPFQSGGEHVDWLEHFAGGFIGTKYPRILAHTLRVEISTSVGASFSCRVEKELRNRLIAEAVRIKDKVAQDKHGH